MKITTLSLWMAVVGSTLIGCSQGGVQKSALGTLSPGNVTNLTGSPASVPVDTGSTPKAKTRALVYKGPGACDEGCWQAAYDMAVRSGLSPTYVGPTDLNSASSLTEQAALFQDAAIWIQPGGVSSEVMGAMSATMTDALRSFVNAGGAYVGFCAGAFSSTQYDGDSSILGFNIFPGLTTVYNDNNQADILKGTWEGKERYFYWEGGPYISSIPAGNAEAIAYYPTGQIAAARSTYGNGKVFIAGFHPEAPQQWRDYYGLNDPDGTDYDLVDEMIQWSTH